MRRWETFIMEYMNTYRKTFVKTVDIEQYLKTILKQEYDDGGGYFRFSSTLKDMVEEEKIQPVKARGHNHQTPPVFNEYRLVKQERRTNPTHIKKLMTNYPLFNMTAFYDEAEFEKWKFYIDRVHAFLTNNSDTKKEMFKANERSFELFRNEKFLLDKEGIKFLANLGLTLSDLNCRRTYEPFVEYQPYPSRKPKIILIIENRDTFDSVKELMMDGINTWSGITFDMVIYGEGDKIQRSYYFLEEYQLEDYEVYYFGDLDARGIHICSELIKIDNRIKPFTPFYIELLNCYGHEPLTRTIERKLKQTIIDDSLRLFSVFFEGAYIDELKKYTKIIQNVQTYIPQEGLNLAILRELGERR
ncbi:Wadjet anti-phage system protein JetD domain-containing protein [Bacillus sp. UNC69MF]|uniref:Wadjet anti-phage system protein JetD domain-containing protein n=1 Tax=Bacillus sp. UNC69MF TaxID=1449047 RepID=UPI00051848BB|nr:Wadjet anti-phage system protein JetD domain-containing protein [Bacillus sp. UNC69MF]